jgi:hypothetical protein
VVSNSTSRPRNCYGAPTCSFAKSARRIETRVSVVLSAAHGGCGVDALFVITRTFLPSWLRYSTPSITLREGVGGRGRLTAREEDFRVDQAPQLAAHEPPARARRLSIGDVVISETKFAKSADDEDSDSSNPLDMMQELEWSHVDSNHGPPACEAGALTS